MNEPWTGKSGKTACINRSFAYRIETKRLRMIGGNLPVFPARFGKTDPFDAVAYAFSRKPKGRRSAVQTGELK